MQRAAFFYSGKEVKSSGRGDRQTQGIFGAGQGSLENFWLGWARAAIFPRDGVGRGVHPC